jgi:hypothetical protein
MPTCYQDNDFACWLDTLVAIMQNAIFARPDSHAV